MICSSENLVRFICPSFLQGRTLINGGGKSGGHVSDHEIWFSPITNRNFTVDKCVEVKHTANGSLQDAGLDKAF
jgi:hypothetical protein